MTVARDRAIREVWTAHTDVWLAVRRLDVADALVNASQKSYEATLESYRRGLGTLIDLLAARRELSRARFVALDTKLQLLRRPLRWPSPRANRRRGEAAPRGRGVKIVRNEPMGGIPRYGSAPPTRSWRQCAMRHPTDPWDFGDREPAVGVVEQSLPARDETEEAGGCAQEPT